MQSLPNNSHSLADATARAVTAPRTAPRSARAIGRRLELPIAATLLLCLSAVLALAEMPVAKATRPTAEVPGKSTNDAAMHEQAVADCERIWDAGTHMTKQEWSRTCRRVQTRLQRIDSK
jgi:hypothetical protein